MFDITYVSYWNPSSTSLLLVIAACVHVIATIRACEIRVEVDENENEH